MSRLPRLLMVWDWVPCESTGAGILLRRLFQDYPADRLWLLTAGPSVRSAEAFRPVPPRQNQRAVFQFFIPMRYAEIVVEFLNLLLIPWMVWRGVRIVRAEKIEALFTVPWSTFFLAAYFIHRIAGVPLHVYVMDDPVGIWPWWRLHRWAHRMWMGRILRAARKVWCVSEYTCEHFEKKYGIACIPLLPPVDVEEFHRAAESCRKQAGAEIQIVYTGAIYTAQLDALRNLVNALTSSELSEGIEGRQISLTLHTSVSEDGLRRMGLWGPRIHALHVPLSEIPRAVAAADILFLPYSFDPKVAHVVQTSFPTKIAEYLASGVPLLVHAPPQSTLARYCRQSGCGLLVDQPDPAALAAGLVKLIADRSFRESLSQKGLEVARTHHERREIVRRLEEHLAM